MDHPAHRHGRVGGGNSLATKLYTHCVPKSPQPPSATSAIPMMPGVRRKWVELVTIFANDKGERSVEEMVAMLPTAPSWRYADLLAMSVAAMDEVYPEEALTPQDFDPVALFRSMDGSNAIEASVSLHVFQQLMVGGGRFPTLYKGPRDVTYRGKNGRKLVFPASVDPYKTKLPVEHRTQKKRHLDLCCAEASAGRLVGPLTEAEANARFDHWVAVSSFVLSKPGAISTKDRLVHNLTDFAHAINLMLEEDCMWKVELDHTSKFIDAVRARAPNPDPLHMVTLDVSKGYRRMFVRPTDQQHLGLRVDIDFDGTVDYFDGKNVTKRTVKKGEVYYMYDRALPFGLVTSVSSFCAVTTMIKMLLQEQLGDSCDVLVYVDDYVLLGPLAAVEHGIGKLRSLLKQVGLPENPLKADTPGQQGCYLGVDYDFTDHARLTATLPDKKKQRYVKHLQFYIDKASVTDGVESLKVSRTELQSIVGKLAFASFVFRSGRPFYQRLLQSLRGSKHKSKHVVLDQGSLDDMRWWKSILEQHTGSLLINPLQREVKVYTDASTTTGYGFIFRGHYYHGTWSDEIKKLLEDFTLTINELELVVLNFALETFGAEWAGCRVHFRCDNQACVANIKSQSSKIPVRASLLRRLYGVAALFGIELTSTYIDTSTNTHADLLSRGDMEKFFSLPQLFPLQKVKEPALAAMDLLVHPKGRANVSHPGWTLK